MAFLESYNAIADPIGKIQLFQKWLVENPTDLFAELRARQPIFVTPGPIVVSRDRPILEARPPEASSEFSSTRHSATPRSHVPARVSTWERMRVWRSALT